MKAIQTDEEFIEEMKRRGYSQEFIEGFLKNYEQFKNVTPPERQKNAVSEIFFYMKEVFPNIENDNAPFICSNKFYSCIEHTIRVMVYFHTAPKLFERKMYGENGWKYSDEYVELFKKIIDFYRTEIYDKIPE